MGIAHATQATKTLFLKPFISCKTGPFEGKGKLSQGKITPWREKILPQKMFRVCANRMGPQQVILDTFGPTTSAFFGRPLKST